MKLPILLSCLSLTFTAVLRAADDDKKAEAAPAVEAPAADLPRVKAGDIEGVKKLVGKKAVVYGKVTSSREVEKSGISFIDLDGGKFTVVCWKESYSKFEGGQSPATLYKGQEIEVTGEIFEYRGKTGKGSPQPEIKLTGLEQVKVISASKEETAGGKKKDSGKKEDATERKEEPKRVDSKKYFR